MRAAAAVALFVGGLLAGIVLQRFGALHPVRVAIDTFAISLAGDRGNVVMVGDSLTAGANWAMHFPDAGIVNRAVSGDTTADTIMRLPAIESTKAKIAFVMLGVNDLHRGLPASETVERYRTIIDALTRHGMTVFVQSTLFTSNSFRNRQIAELNSGLRAVCATKCRFIDLNKALAPDAVLSEPFTFDGVHLTMMGYQVWADEIRSFLLRPPAAEAIDAK